MNTNLKFHDYDVLVLGDQSARLVCLMTTVQERAAGNSFAGVTRVSQVFSLEQLWVTVNLVLVEDNLVDSFLGNTATEPFEIVLVTYTYGSASSLEAAKNQVQRFGMKPGSKAKTKTPAASTNSDRDLDALAPESMPVGPVLLVAVPPEPVGNKVTLKIGDDVSHFMSPFGSVPMALYNVATCQSVYKWIFDVFRTNDANCTLTPEDVASLVKYLEMVLNVPEDSEKVPSCVVS
eukprot:GFYU01018769.1.p1 GENE.GFYU01018769.1~~GFYU01018769.1.p1  ORF type:complete len:234 (+),score=19.42 GFYU01018769.1:143-844(+)